MGMILELHAVSDDTIRLLLERPARIHQFLQGEPPPAAPPPPPPSFFARLFGAKPAPPPPSEPLVPALDQPDHATVDLDKAWHGIHYLLTGEGNPQDDAAAARDLAQWLLYGGAWVGEEDVGYGPARALTAAETKRWCEFLSAQNTAEMRDRFNPTDMTAKGVYPSIWDRDPAEDDTLGYVMVYFDTLCEFLAERVEAGEGVLICLT